MSKSAEVKKAEQDAQDDYGADSIKVLKGLDCFTYGSQ